MAVTYNLYCETGEHYWQRPPSRGRNPRNCPEHLVLRSSNGAKGSQRSESFNGGIQEGTSATSANSSELDHSLKDAVKYYTNYLGLRTKSEYTYQELSYLFSVGDYYPLSGGGARPDGPIILKEDGLPAIVFEAKYQGPAGNAVERWCKNWIIFKNLGVERYITVCSGTGFYDNNTPMNILETIMLVEGQVPSWNTGEGRLQMYRFESKEEAKEKMYGLVENVLGEYFSQL